MENMIPYHQDTTRISKSGTDLMHPPAKYEYKYLQGNFDDDTNALILGRALHELILEPDKFAENYVLMPEFKGEGKYSKIDEFKKSNQGKEFISLDMYNQISGMRESALKHPKVKKLLKSGRAEVELHWTDKFSGAKCKCRLDWLSDTGYVVDIKSTDDASDIGFSRSVRKFRYDVQDAFYTDGCEANGIIPKGFIFVAIEKKPPYLTQLHILTEYYREIGRGKYKEDLVKYTECKELNQWPGYSEEINVIHVPDFI